MTAQHLFDFALNFMFEGKTYEDFQNDTTCRQIAWETNTPLDSVWEMADYTLSYLKDIWFEEGYNKATTDYLNSVQGSDQTN